MPPKGSSNRAVNQQATAAAKNTSNKQGTTAEQVSNQQGLVLPTTRRSSPRKPRQRSNVEATTEAVPAVMVELAEEEGDQTPYFNHFQR